MKVAIVTPTIASEYLKQCILSVQKQTYDNIVHYIFIDGQKYETHVEDTIYTCLYNNNKQIETVKLSKNVGEGWYGHRVYAASSFLVDADVICYLDEDNWIEPNHIESLLKVLSGRCSWAYSLRKIYSKDGEYLLDDNCESLGKWPVHFDDNVFHIDTSCYAVKRDVALQIGHSWYGKWGADRQFFAALKRYFPDYNCSKKYSLCYRLDGNQNSVTKDFFENGNKNNNWKYKGKFPWR